MASLSFQFTQNGYLIHRPQTQKPLPCSLMLASGSSLRITCGLRSGPRRPMLRKRPLSSEAIQAVQSLKLSKSSPARLDQVIRSRISRLLKADLLDTLSELQRQNELELSLKVFEFVRTEVWYEPDNSLFGDMILLFGKNRLTARAEELFAELRKEGLEPNARAYAEMIGVYLKVDMTEKAMEMYELMKASGCKPDKLTLTILIRSLTKSGEEELVEKVKKECASFMDYPEKFLEEIERKHVSKSTVDII